jgi:hypothetical protein
MRLGVVLHWEHSRRFVPHPEYSRIVQNIPTEAQVDIVSPFCGDVLGPLAKDRY